jgi:hypothetical protein
MSVYQIGENVYQVEISKYKTITIKAKNEKDAIRKAKRRKI